MDKSPSGPGVAQGPEQAVAGKAAAREALPWLAGQTLPSPAGRNPQRMHDEGEIARGGMGSIHKLHDPQLRRHVAVKVLDPKLARDPEHARRFVDEARIMGALGHPNIVPVHDLSTDEKGRVSYTMKLIEGRTLSVLINEQASRRDLERILRCLATVCDVLAFAHSRQIIHRDIKPDNIMVDDFGQVYLMDWGSALVKGDRSLVDGAVEPEGTVAGTVRYMAPEQARGEISRIDGRTDVFAVGAILYKALSGKAPYEGNTRATLEAARRAEYRPLEECPGVAVKPPPMLMAIARKAMAADPARRHQTAAELAEDLRDFMQAGDWFALHVFPIGKVIVREGDWADAAYIITDGRCEVRHRDPKDPRREVALRVLGPGDVFGETAIFADAPRSATVVALEEVRAVMLDRAALEQLAASTYLGKFVKALAGAVPGTGSEGAAATGDGRHASTMTLQARAATLEPADLEALLAVTRSLAAPIGLHELLEAVAAAASQVLHAERTSVWLLDEAHGELVLEVASDLRQVRVAVGSGLVGRCAQTRLAINVPDCYADPRFNAEVDRRSGFHTRCSLSLPLIDHQGHLVGVLQILNKRGGVFDEGDEAVGSALAAQCAVVLARARMTEALLAGERLRQEIELASSLQRSTLPEAMPQVPGYAMHATFMPASLTGGDTYDLAPHDQGLLLVLGDAAGHGLAAAVPVMQMQAMLRMALRLGADLETAFRQVNDQLAATLPDSRFVTAFIGLLDLQTHHLRFLSGGQAPILHWQAANQSCQVHRATSFPMGAMPIKALKPAIELVMQPGDWLLLLTDGIYEYANAAGESFGRTRVEQVLRTSAGVQPQDLALALLAALEDFAAGAPQEDDITMVLLQRQPEQRHNPVAFSG